MRPHLRFLPEDASSSLCEAWQAERWRTELDLNFASPMVRKDDQDFYVYEPAQLENGQFCMLVRWFTRGDETLAEVWSMAALERGWVVLKHSKFEVNVWDFMVSFPHLVEIAGHRSRWPDPREIIGMLTLLTVLAPITYLTIIFLRPRGKPEWWHPTMDSQ